MASNGAGAPAAAAGGAAQDLAATGGVALGISRHLARSAHAR